MAKKSKTTKTSSPTKPSAPKPIKKLSFEQRKALLLTPCKTKDELNRWIKYHTGFHIPDCTVSRYADTNPLDAIWEVYDICVNNNNPKNIQELLYVAARGSGKTLGMAIAELAVMLHDQRDVCHVGAILSQAKRCYDYQIKFMLNDKMRSVLQPPGVDEQDRILRKANMEKSVFNLSSGNNTTLEILPCTLKACLVSDSIALDGGGILKPLKNFNIGDLIQSPQGLVDIIDYKIKHEECIRIELDDGRIIEGTLDHKVWTQRGWVELQHLTDDDDIVHA